MSALTREAYVKLLKDLLSRDPARVRDANRILFPALVETEADSPEIRKREADLTLAEVAG